MQLQPKYFYMSLFVSLFIGFLLAGGGKDEKVCPKCPEVECPACPKAECPVVALEEVKITGEEQKNNSDLKGLVWDDFTTKELEAIKQVYLESCKSNDKFCNCAWQFNINAFTVDEYMQAIDDKKVREQHMTLIGKACGSFL